MKNTENTKLLIPTFRGFRGVTINNIIFCQADNYYSKVYLFDESVFSATITLKALVELINSDLFFRCHNSYIINIKFF